MAYTHGSYRMSGTRGWRATLSRKPQSEGRTCPHSSNGRRRTRGFPGVSFSVAGTRHVAFLEPLWWAGSRYHRDSHDDGRDDRTMVRRTTRPPLSDLCVSDG